MARTFWTWGLEKIVLPLGDHIVGQSLCRSFRFLEQAQWWSPEKVEDYQTSAFLALVETVSKEVPFYRRYFSEQRLTAKDFKGLRDLTKLPIMTKELLRQASLHDLGRPTKEKTYEVSSSGSTGQNVSVREALGTTGRLRACHLLALSWSGWSLGNRHVQFGIALPRTLLKSWKDRLFRCRYASAFYLTDEALDAILLDIRKLQIEHLHGYPGCLYQLAQRAERLSYRPKMRGIVTWGDNLYGHYRKKIESVFQRKIQDQYGCGEGIAVGAQCEHSDRYHTYSTEVVMEFVNDQGEPVGDQEIGHLLLTRLQPGAMPLIRYKVGDLGIRGSRSQCSCGRGFFTFQAIEGRDTDFILTPSGNRLVVHFFTGILAYFPQIVQFQVRQQAQDHMRMFVICDRDFPVEAQRTLIETLRSHGADIETKIEIVKEIPLTRSGKRRFVINETHDS